MCHALSFFGLNFKPMFQVSAASGGPSPPVEQDSIPPRPRCLTEKPDIASSSGSSVPKHEATGVQVICIRQSGIHVNVVRMFPDLLKFGDLPHPCHGNCPWPSPFFILLFLLRFLLFLLMLLVPLVILDVVRGDGVRWCCGALVVVWCGVSVVRASLPSSVKPSHLTRAGTGVGAALRRSTALDNETRRLSSLTTSKIDFLRVALTCYPVGLSQGQGQG